MLFRELSDASRVGVSKAKIIVLNGNRTDGPKACIHLQFSDVEHAFDWLGKIAETIEEFLAHIGHRLDIAETADPSIHVDLLTHVDDIIGGQVCFDR